MTTAADLLDIIKRDRARRSRRAKVLAFLGKLLLVVVAALLDGWLFMITMGVVREHWIPQVPGIGFWWSVWLVWVLRSIFTPLKWDRKS